MISVQKLSIQYGAFVLKDVSFDVPTGEYCVLMGKTGSGKTSILEAIIGLRSLDKGRIFLGGRDVTLLRPAERGIGYVPQDGALFSTMTVRDHLAFSLKIRKYEPERIKKRVEELAELLGITHLLKRKPVKLSGGEAQRVSLGRALAFKPKILCLDEPLSALDPETRAEMYELLKSVREATHVTTLHVTHSQQEASVLAARLLILDEGGEIREGSLADIGGTPVGREGV